MLRFSFLIYMVIGFVLLQSCNTLTNTTTIKLEIFIPGTVQIPSHYKKVAIAYNNSNVSPNPYFSNYFEDNKKIEDKNNVDSIASEIYFQIFSNHLKNQQFFDTIIELAPKNYSDIKLNDSLIYVEFDNHEDLDSIQPKIANFQIYNFTKYVNRFFYNDSNKLKTKFIDPEFGLYSKKEIQEIADSTDADLFLSFDYFASVDGIFSPMFTKEMSDTLSIYNPFHYHFLNANEVVYNLTCWNFYDLKKMDLIYSHIKTDTITWTEPAYTLKEAMRILPPRLDAVYNAADISGLGFAEFLVPHWTEVERVYYKSGQIELKKTDDLVEQNRWLEAAEIWKKNTTNKNKSIAAKSMFNMALACEMNNDMDAAIDWVVKSFYAFQKDPYHSILCKKYIEILGGRKLDIQQIESLFNEKN